MFRSDVFENLYNVFEEIGSGHFAVVRRCREKVSGQEYAAKFIRKKRAQASRRGLSMEDITREVSILTELNSHPNVISLKEVFDNNTNVILVLELVRGGELFDILVEKRCLQDGEASHFIHQILLGLEHLHQRHIAHLDLKPENIMVKDKLSQSIKIIDFGLARKLKGANLAREMMGTPEFVAPEIINFDPISLSTDLWSLGVITYILLSGASPFLGQTRQETFENIVKIDYSFDEEYFSQVSESGKDFIRKLLVGDSRKRLGVKECLYHPWIKGPLPIKDSQYLPLLSIQSPSNNDQSPITQYNDSLSIKNGDFVIKNFQHGNTNCLYDNNSLYTDKIQNGHDKCFNGSVICESRPSSNEATIVDVNGLDDVLVNRDGIKLSGNGISVDFLLPSDSDINNKTLTQFKPKISTLRCMFLWQRAVKLVSLCLRLFKCPPLPLMPFSLVPKRIHDKRAHDDIRTDILKRLHYQLTLYNTQVFPLTLLTPNLTFNRAIIIMEASGEDTLFSAFLYACDSGNILAIREMLALTSISLNQTNDESETGLHLAIKNGHLDIIRFLHSQSADLEITNSTGETPLFYAAKYGHPHITDFLIQVGCNVNARNQNKEAALHLAVNHANCDVVEIFCQTPSLNLNIQDELGDSPLHLAVWHGLLTIVHILCSNSSIDLNMRNTKGESPLHIAASQGKMACLKRLIEAGANLDAQDKGNVSTPLHNAMMRHQIPCALLLIDSGCALDIPDIRGDAPIHLACKEGLLPIVQALCAFGCEVNLLNSVGMSPLHIAARYGRLEVCRCLCLACCDVSARVGGITDSLTTISHSSPPYGPTNKDSPVKTVLAGGLTASELAATHGHHKISDLLDRLTKPDFAPYGIYEDVVTSGLLTCPLPFSPGKSQTHHQDRDSRDGRDKVRTHSTHANLVSQLLPSTGRTGQGEWLPCVKLKLLGSPGAGKSRLVSGFKTLNPSFSQSQQNGTSTSFGARRHSDRFTNMVMIKPGTQFTSFFSQGRRHSKAKYIIAQGCDDGNNQGTIKPISDYRGGNNDPHLRSGTAPIPMLAHKATMTPKCDGERKRFYNFRQSSFSSLDGGASSILNNLIRGNSPFSNLGTHVGNHSGDLSTKGIAITNLAIPGAGPFSIWDFSGYHPYRQTYDHFIGSVNSAHLVVFDASLSLEDIIADARYWLNFLRARICLEEPLVYGGSSTKLAPVALVGTHADSLWSSLQGLNDRCDLISLEAFKNDILTSLLPDFTPELDLYNHVFLVESSPKMKPYNGMSQTSTLLSYLNDEWLDLIQYMEHTKMSLVQQLPHITDFLQATLPALASWRKLYYHCPVMPWPLFVEHIHDQVNCLASFDHLKELIIQLQFMGEVLYIKWDAKRDMVVMDPAWLCSNVLGKFLSPSPKTIFFQEKNKTFPKTVNELPVLTIDSIAQAFPNCDVVELLPLLEALQLCTQCQTQNSADDLLFEFACLGAIDRTLTSGESHYVPNFGISLGKEELIYGGYRIKPYMPHCQALIIDLFSRIQARFRFILQEHLDDGDNNLFQYASGSRLVSGPLECLVNLSSTPSTTLDDHSISWYIDLISRGPAYMCSTLFYFLNDVTDIIDDVIGGALPGLAITKHVFDPQGLKTFFESWGGKHLFYQMEGVGGFANFKTYSPADIWISACPSRQTKDYSLKKGLENCASKPVVDSQDRVKNNFNDLKNRNLNAFNLAHNHIGVKNGHKSVISIETENTAYLSKRSPVPSGINCQGEHKNIRCNKFDLNFDKDINDSTRDPKSNDSRSQHNPQMNSSDTLGKSHQNCLFTRAICFGSKDVRSNLTPSWDLPPHQLSIHARKLLCHALDPPDPLGRDWCLFALNLGLSSRLPDIDGVNIDKNDMIISEEPPNCYIDADIAKSDAYSIMKKGGSVEKSPAEGYDKRSGSVNNDHYNQNDTCTHLNKTKLFPINANKQALSSTDSLNVKTRSKTHAILEEWITEANIPSTTAQHLTLGTLVDILRGPCGREDVAQEIICLLPLFTITPRTTVFSSAQENEAEFGCGNDSYNTHCLSGDTTIFMDDNNRR